MSSSGAILIIFILLHACSTTKEKPANSAENSDSVNTVTKTQTDTIPKPPPPPEPGLAPGQAKVMGNIGQISSRHLDLKVTKIEGYGSSTPPIALQDTITIGLSEQTVQKNKQLKVGSEVTLLIFSNIPLEGKSSPPPWSLVKLYQ